MAILVGLIAAPATLLYVGTLAPRRGGRGLNFERVEKVEGLAAMRRCFEKCTAVGMMAAAAGMLSMHFFLDWNLVLSLYNARWVKLLLLKVVWICAANLLTAVWVYADSPASLHPAPARVCLCPARMVTQLHAHPSSMRYIFTALAVLGLLPVFLMAYLLMAFADAMTKQGLTYAVNELKCQEMLASCQKASVIVLGIPIAISQAVTLAVSSLEGSAWWALFCNTALQLASLTCTFVKIDVEGQVSHRVKGFPVVVGLAPPFSAAMALTAAYRGITVLTAALIPALFQQRVPGWTWQWLPLGALALVSVNLVVQLLLVWHATRCKDKLRWAFASLLSPVEPILYGAGPVYTCSIAGWAACRAIYAGVSCCVIIAGNSGHAHMLALMISVEMLALLILRGRCTISVDGPLMHRDDIAWLLDESASWASDASDGPLLLQTAGQDLALNRCPWKWLCEWCASNHVLNLNDVRLGNRGTTLVARLLDGEDCCCTKELHLRDNMITADGCVHLTGVLKRRTKNLLKLDLDNNSLGEAGASMLTEALLEGEAPVEWMSIANNGIGDKGAEHFAQLMRKRPSQLKRLYMGKNGLTGKGVAALAASLDSSEVVLETLILNANPVGDAGAEKMAAALRGNGRLKNLYMKACGIEDEGSLSLAGAASQHPRLEKLCLDGNKIRSEVTFKGMEAALVHARAQSKALTISW